MRQRLPARSGGSSSSRPQSFLAARVQGTTTREVREGGRVSEATVFKHFDEGGPVRGHHRAKAQTQQVLWRDRPAGGGPGTTPASSGHWPELIERPNPIPRSCG